MTIKYHTGGYHRGAEIQLVECERETDKCAWIRISNAWGTRLDRVLKVSDHSVYHDTWEDARTHLIKRAEMRVETAKIQLARSEKELAAAQAVPTEPPQ